MTKELLIASSPHETKVAVLEDDQLVEVYFQRDTDAGLAGGIYKGRVSRVLPGMQSAFVNIGLERDAFLYVSDFFEDSEEYDRVFTEAENRVARLAGDAGAPAPVQAAATATSSGQIPPRPGALTPSPGESAESAPAALELPRTPASERPPITGEPENSAGRPSPVSPGRFERRRFGGGRLRRGQRFSNERFTKPPEAQEDREQPAFQGLQLLPGESLAKYGHLPEGQADEPKSHGTENDFGGDEIIETVSPEPGADLSGHAEPAFAETHNSGFDVEPPAASERIEESHQSEPAAPAEVPITFEEKDERLAELSNRPVLDTEPQPDEGHAVHADLSEMDAAPEAHIPTEPAGFAETGGPEAAAAEVAGQSYTLRDSERRPRIAPQRRGRRGRGRFRPHHETRPEAAQPAQADPRASTHRPAPISELLKEGQEILVQIAKAPLGAKGARITSHIALPGRYLVYMPTISHIGVSRKIGSEEERLRLRSIILQHKGSLTGGFIVRTAGAGRSEEDIKADLAFLTNLWNDIRAKAERAKAPALLHRDLTLVERILRDLLSPEFKSVRMDNETEYEHVLEFVQRFQPSLIGQVKLYTRNTPLFEELGVQADIDKALKPKVWLKSGGYIVINQTEALVAIDVNTGKYVGKTNRLEDTIVKTNIDAVKEIVRQIRLRDLGGIIVIDFIDMDDRRNRVKVVQTLEDALRHDRAPTKILAFNEFGLVALTRKRVKQSLERTLCEPCPHCSGAGWIKSVGTVSNEIAAEARKMAAEIDGKFLNLRVHPSVAAALKAKGGMLAGEIEAATGKELLIKSDPEAHEEEFEIF
ncbi:MAG: Rne/Rng family ribonuclease [Terriglobia bacterium]